jgi:HD-like signal output (HDOD) protein
MTAVASDLIDEEQSKALLKGIRIPPQPQILADIHLEMAMPGFSLSDIADIVSKDIGLAGHVLKTVNSAAFGFSQTVTAISQAISLIGLNSLVNLVNAISLVQNLSDEAAANLGPFWDNAHEVATASLYIAKRLHYREPEESYALGLFHNCGILLLQQKYPDYLSLISQAYGADEGPITDVENEAIQTNHAVIGYFVARSWKLPDYFSQAIAQHHKADHVLTLPGESPRKKTLLAILKVASHLCQTPLTLGAEEDGEFPRIRQALLRQLDITEVDLDEWREELFHQGVYSCHR